MVVFFAFEPPAPYPYPYTNVYRYRWFFKHKFDHALLDCGVEIFWKTDEYPAGFLQKYVNIAKLLSEIYNEKIWIVIPDYCDDYKHVPDNVEKTIRNIKQFIKIGGVNWLPVIQSRFLDLFSFYESIEKTKEVIGNDYPRVAIGTVCKTRNMKFIIECCRAARQHFTKSWIHAFGLTLSALPKVKKYIDSFDSSAYTFPRRPGKSSCSNMNERKQYFLSFCNRINQLLEHGGSEI